MTANVTSDTTNEVRYYVRTIEFENVAPILLERRYSHGGKEFLPTYATARWNHGEPIEAIKVAGAVLKSDRTAGKQITDIEYCTPASRHWGKGWYSLNAPEWLLAMFGIES